MSSIWQFPGRRGREGGRGQHISRGADFIIPNANAAGIGVIQAVREAGPDICTFGVFTDMT